MAKKTRKQRLIAFLRREYHIPVPDNQVGKTLRKPVKGPRFWQKFVGYVRDSWTELRKVTWPGRKESIRLTIAVVVFTGVYTAYTSVVDFGFQQVVEQLFL